MGRVAHKPDAERPEVVAQNGVCALQGRDQPIASGQTHSRIFELPGIQFAWGGDASWSDPPFLQCFDHPFHMPSVERCFSSIDYRVQRRNKTLAYAQALQDWAEKACTNLSSRDMAQCVMEMQERMHGLVDLTLKDLQVSQLKKKEQSPMCQRGEKPKVASTATTSEGATTPATPNAHGMKPPLRFKAKPEDPRLPPLIGTASGGPLPLE